MAPANTQCTGSTDDTNITICGGGNAAHILVGLLAQRGYTVNVYAPFSNEAEQWNKSNGVTIQLPNEQSAFGKPNQVSKFPENVIPQADLVIMPIPSFAIKPTLEQIAPHLKQNAIIGAFPGSGGFHWNVREIIRHQFKRNDVIVFGSNQLPYNCRYISYATQAQCLGIKKKVKLATSPPAAAEEVSKILQKVCDPIEFVTVSHMLSLCLYPANQVIHPARLYDLFHDWQDTTVYKEPPMFYAGFTDETAKLADAICKDLKNVANALDQCEEKLFGKIKYDIGSDVDNMRDAMMFYYGDMIEDSSTLKTCFTTNTGYVGLRTPMKCIGEKKYIPLFEQRYFTEDIPYGLCLVKGLADLVDVDVPTIDKLILWAQVHLGKEFIVQGKLKGKDVHTCSTAPQAFGINSAEQLFSENY